MAIAASLVLFIVGYFIFMLPSLYVEYVKKSDLNCAEQIQRAYMADRSYDNLRVKNPTAVYTVEIPDQGDSLFIRGKFVSVTAKINDSDLQEILDEFRTQMKSGVTERSFPESGADGFGELFSRVEEIFAKEELLPKDYPIRLDVQSQAQQDGFRSEYTKMHSISERMLIFEAGVFDEDFGYTTYIAMGRTDDAFIFTFLPTMTPQMEEITPVVTQSLPMIIAVVFLLVLIASRYFSGKIVRPVIRLSNYAQNVQFAGEFQMDAFEIRSGDEIEALGCALHELFEKLYENCRILEQKNRRLEEENERQEVFLRATSHQLKTPVAAGLLLSDGMIQEVGKYKDTGKYLPQIKEQFLSMRKIIEDVLALNYHTDDLQKEEVDLITLAREISSHYQVQISEKNLSVSFAGSGTIYADRDMLKKIMDNLISNAITYTPDHEQVRVEAGESCFLLYNYGVTVDKNLLPDLFLPFVTSDGSRKGKGLGLYLAAYYSRAAGLVIEIENVENGVCAKLCAKKEA